MSRCYLLSVILFFDLHGFNSAVLDFTMELVQTGVENDVALALVVFSFQFVLVNHEYWKYKVKHARWKVTLKVPLGVPRREKQDFVLFSTSFNFGMGI